MKERKISFLLIVSFALILLSFLALGILGYKFYRKVDQAMINVPAVDPSAKMRDSLLMVYTQTIQRLEEKLGYTIQEADSLENDLAFKLDEYYRTRDELIYLISNPKSDEDFELAKYKIDELQANIKALRKTNINLSEENKKLHTVVDELRKQPIAPPPTRAATPLVSAPQTPASQPTTTATKPVTTSTAMVDPKPQPQKQASLTQVNEAKVVTPTEVKEPEKPAVKNIVKQPSVFSLTDLRLEPYQNDPQSDNVELIGSFSIKNISDDKARADLLIVVTQPDGKVVQKSSWESGTFMSDNGRKIYSCRLRIENDKGEMKKLTFSLPGDKSLKGTYTIQIYNNGMLIGNSQRTIS